LLGKIMFENLTNKFEEIFSSLKKAPSLNARGVDEGLRGIRQALLEADVALPVAKKIIENIRPKIIFFANLDFVIIILETYNIIKYIQLKNLK
jgi:signal recognition particle GTPase